MELVSPASATTRAIGAAIASVLRAGDVVVLTGDLGSGKTELAKGIAAALGVVDRVVSPTFAIVREYEGRMPVHHLDVYRLGRMQEAIDLGIEELLDDGVVIVEWGEAVGELLPADRVEVALAFGPPDPAAEDVRHVTVVTSGPGWVARAGALERALRAAVNAPC